MVLRQKLTPEVFLSAPRRSAAVPSPSGKLAFFTVSTHTFASDDDVTQEKGTTVKELMLMNLATGEHWPLITSHDADVRFDQASDITWVPRVADPTTCQGSGSTVDQDELLWLRPAADKPGVTEVVVATAVASGKPADGQGTIPTASPSFYVATTVAAPIKALKLKPLPDGTVAFAAAGLVGPDGALYNDQAPENKRLGGLAGIGGQVPPYAGSSGVTMPAAVPGSTARVYDTWQVREWDSYLKPCRYSIWYGSLQKKVSEGTTGVEGKMGHLAMDGELVDIDEATPPAEPEETATTATTPSTILKPKPSFSWTLTPLHNALRGAGAGANLEAPAGIYEPGNTAGSFDMSAQGIVFVGRHPQPQQSAEGGCNNVFYIPLDSFATDTQYAPTKISILGTPGSPLNTTAPPPPSSPPHTPQPISTWTASHASAAYHSNPRFSPDGTMLAFLRSPLSCPADTRFFMGHIVSGAAFDVVNVVIKGGEAEAGEGGGGEQRNPAEANDDCGCSPFIIISSFEFAPSGSSIIFIAEDCGRRDLFALDIERGARPWRIGEGKAAQGGTTACRKRLSEDAAGTAPPSTATRQPHGSVSAFHLVRQPAASPGDTSLAWYWILVSGSSLVEPSFYELIDLEEEKHAACCGRFEPRVLSTATRGGSKFGLSHAAQVDEMYFAGGGEGYCVQAWVVKPSDFDAAKRYPVAVIIHGGPESMWTDEWHYRWNAAVWAEQGYVVVLPNITGSTGFGLSHTTRIYGSWGGYPYEDLVQCMAHLAQVPYIDSERAVVAGASYGGYMVDWILGSPLGKQFKAAVTHDCVFTTEYMGLTSDYCDGIATFRGNGLPWANHEQVARWNPARPDKLGNWKAFAPPTLVIHSDRDYRCVVTDGLQAFRALQFQGVPSRFLTFPDECHFVLNADNALAWNRAILGWVNHWGRDGKDGGQSQ